MANIKDHIAVMDAHRAVQAAFAALSGLGDNTPDYQVLGCALLLRVIAERAGLDLSELINQAGRMEKDADDFFRREVKALRDYVDGEIKNWDPKARQVNAAVVSAEYDRNINAIEMARR